MPYKDREKQLAAQRKHYHDNKETYRERTKLRREKLYRLVRRYKVLVGCKDCEEKHPSCLQFHHLDPEQKDDTISNAVNHRYFSIKRLKNEIRKCIVLCANCHAKLHWEKGNFSNL